MLPRNLGDKCDRFQPLINFVFDISNAANFLEEIGVKWWQDLNLLAPVFLRGSGAPDDPIASRTDLTG